MVVPRKARRKYLSGGSEAVIYRIRKAPKHRRILRIETSAAGNTMQVHPKIRIYSNLIAKILFPDNVIHFSTLIMPKKTTIRRRLPLNVYYTHPGIEYYSREVHTTQGHKKANRQRNKKRSKPDFSRHSDAINSSKEIKIKLKEMRRAGFDVDDYPTNIDLVNGKPVFFELTAEDPGQIEAYINQKKLSRPFTETDRQKALRLARRLKQLWSEIEQKRGQK